MADTFIRHRPSKAATLGRYAGVVARSIPLLSRLRVGEGSMTGRSETSSSPDIAALTEYALRRTTAQYWRKRSGYEWKNAIFPPFSPTLGGLYTLNSTLLPYRHFTVFPVIPEATRPPAFRALQPHQPYRLATVAEPHIYS